MGAVKTMMLEEMEKEQIRRDRERICIECGCRVSQEECDIGKDMCFSCIVDNDHS